MKVSETNTVTISLTEEEVKEAVVFWLSRSSTKSTTQSCALACYLNNDNPKIRFAKKHLTLEFKGTTKEEDI